MSKTVTTFIPIKPVPAAPCMSVNFLAVLVIPAAVATALNPVVAPRKGILKILGAKPAKCPKLCAIASYVVLGLLSGGTKGNKPLINPEEKFCTTEDKVVVSLKGLKDILYSFAFCCNTSSWSSSKRFGCALY